MHIPSSAILVRVSVKDPPDRRQAFNIIGIGSSGQALCLQVYLVLCVGIQDPPDKDT